MPLILRLFIVTLLVILSAGTVWASGPLPVIYGEDEDDPIVESQQSYIDNQAYLREFENQRRTRVLSPTRKAPVAVIRKKSRVRSFSPFSFPYYRDHESSDFLSIEVQGEGTTIRYVDGYQPNCCGPYYHVQPRPLRPTPYNYPGRSPH